MPRRHLATLLLTTMLGGCGMLSGPTPLAPAARTRVEVVYENHTDEAYVVSIVGAAPDQQGFGTVDPCSTSAVSIAAEPPFEIGLGRDLEGGMVPQPVIANSDDFEDPSDGQYRYFIRIGADGDVESGTSIGPPEFGSGSVC